MITRSGAHLVWSSMYPPKPSHQLFRPWELRCGFPLHIWTGWSWNTKKRETKTCGFPHFPGKNNFFWGDCEGNIYYMKHVVKLKGLIFFSKTFGVTKSKQSRDRWVKGGVLEASKMIWEVKVSEPLYSRLLNGPDMLYDYRLFLCWG